MRANRLGWMSLLAWVFFGGLALAQSESLAPLLKALRDVQPEGKGNRAATTAWAELISRAQSDQLPVILAAMDDAGPLASNWLRAAVDAIAERDLRKHGKLPNAELEKFLAQKQHSQRARRLAFEWIARNDPSAEDRLIPTMLDDPSLELRRDAVARVLSAADKALVDKQLDLALSTYRTALDSARDLDQVKTVTEALKQLGHPVDLSRHYGFLADWKLVGPFDNHGGKGFDVAYPPEGAIDLAAAYPVQSGTVRWISHHTDSEVGSVDLNKAIGKHMGVVAYAMAEFQSDQARPADLRVGSECAVKFWLNGKPIFSVESYHANGTIDQYIGRGELKAGRNVILVKVCQNEQTEEWAQDWRFQLRVCDATGQAILSTDRPASRAAEDQTAVNQ
jgi:hypothetical protein